MPLFRGLQILQYPTAGSSTPPKGREKRPIAGSCDSFPMGSGNATPCPGESTGREQKQGSSETGHPVHKQKGVSKIDTPTTTKAARMRTADRKEGQQ